MKNKLIIKNFSVRIGKKTILRKVNLTIESGKIFVLMGHNGSGKSTLAAAIMGHPQYRTSGKIILNNEEITKLPTFERAKKGIFLAFQFPVEIPGITVFDIFQARAEILSSPLWQREFKNSQKLLMGNLKLSKDLVERPLNLGFSGGEKKKFEILQLAEILPKIAILDEIDSGLDIDSLKTVTNLIIKFKKEGMGLMFITHTPRLLKYLPVDKVHILFKGRIAASGKKDLIKEIERKGYGNFK